VKSELTLSNQSAKREALAMVILNKSSTFTDKLELFAMAF
jgi:hypothetical protein